MIYSNIYKILLTFFLVLCSIPVSADYSGRKDIKQFTNFMADTHGFKKEKLLNLLSGAIKQESILKAISRPAEKTKTWEEYRPIFLNEKRIRQGVQFLHENKELLAKVEKEYGVPKEIIVAIVGVETYYGRRSGSYSVLNALITLGFDYPPRSKFFRKELEHFLLLTREEKLNPSITKGSYAGAMGVPQFISSSYREYAIDFDNDGKRDLWNSTEDVIGSVANYFSRHGWVKGKEIIVPAIVSGSGKSISSKKTKPYVSVSDYAKKGVQPKNTIAGSELATLLYFEGSNGTEYWMGLQNFYVITRYNHSALYALAVYQLSQEIKNRSQ